MYYGTLAKITGGWTSSEIKQQDFWRQVEGKARMTIELNIAIPNQEARKCNVCCYAPDRIAQEEALWLYNNLAKGDSLPMIWDVAPNSRLAQPKEKSNSEHRIWRLSGWAGVIKNPDLCMHELIFAEYDAEHQKGVACIAFEEETVANHPELFTVTQLNAAPCSDKELEEAATKWGISLFLRKAVIVDRARAERQKQA